MLLFQAPAGAGLPIPPVANKTRRATSALFSITPNRPADVIITAVQYEQKVAAQFKTSLRRVLYVFPFGDKPSQVTLTFAVFLYDCDGNPTTAVEDLLNYYDEVKLKPTDDTPVQVVIGGKAINAFVLSLNLGMQQGGVQTVVTATMTLVGWNLSQ